MTEHELKIWPEYYDAVARRVKTFECRRNDRGFKVGDILRLREYNPHTCTYTGNEVFASVQYMLPASPEFGIADGFVVMSIGIRRWKQNA